jgi:hypothetical protein
MTETQLLLYAAILLLLCSSKLVVGLYQGQLRPRHAAAAFPAAATAATPHLLELPATAAAAQCAAHNNAAIGN